MRKGDLLENIVIDTMASEGKCVARVNGIVIFLRGGAPGDTVTAQVTKIRSSFLEGIVKEVVIPSMQRSDAFCSHFGTCGGCTWQHIQYETQLFYKQKQVVDNLERIGGLQLPEIRTIIPSKETTHYRNKLDYTFSAQRWMTTEELNQDLDPEPALGYHIPRRFDKIFDVECCHLQADPSNAIRLAVKDEAIKNKIPFFHLREQIGFLRTLTIRSSIIGEVMVILQVTDNKNKWIEAILMRLANDFPTLTSINYVINGKRNDTFNDLDVICWKGKPYITEKMNRPDSSGTLEFRVGPKSFYQTNSAQAFQLYKVAFELAALTGTEVVYDLYTGTGTIANFISQQSKKVIGLDYVQEAIDDAKVNSHINGISNTEFFAGDIKDLLNENFISEHGAPDVIITDPPRAGMHESVCRMLLIAKPQRIVYVSCNAATQARDLKILSEKYSIVAVQPVDMFPHTMHVENVVSLERI